MSEKDKDNMVDLAPVTEKSNRINKLVIAVIIFVLAILIMYLVFGGKEKKKAAQPEQLTTTTNTTFLTAEDMRKLAADAEAAKQPTKEKGSENSDSKSSPQQQRQLSVAEKNEMELQRREWENAQKAQAIREKEDTVGYRSDIFFEIPAMNQKTIKNSSPAVNQRYNSGDENYIQVVGGR